ncbi:MAG: hypothetical protein K2Y33_06090 [Mycolicibacterium frederiksbergense]|nr:hypothetical protein [Mycolicibacterium frederiksbergense]
MEALMMSKPDPVVVAKWQRLIAEQAQSQLTVQAFCRQRRIAKSCFYRWKSILTKPASPIRAAPTAPKRSVDTPVSTTFVPLRVIPDTLVEVMLPSGIQLRLPLSAHADQVAQLIKAVTAC